MQGREARGTLPGDDRPLEDICDAAMNDVAPSRLGRVTGRGRGTPVKSDDWSAISRV